MLRNRTTLVHILIIAVLSLIPFLWLKPGQAILGHDAGFPISPWPHFLDRLFVWTYRYGLGSDQTIAVGGFFIHGFEGLVSKLGFTLTQVQQITFSAYFFGFGMSMYVLARTLFPERKKYLPLIAAIMYMLNHFILQGWFIAERTKFTLYIALPLVIACIFKMYKKEMNSVTAAVICAIILFFLNGGGFFPLFGAFLISIPVILILLTIFDRKTLLSNITKFGVFTVVWAITTIGASAFWILPYIRFVTTSYSAELGNAGGTQGVIAWVQAISEHSSFYNLLRLQGIQEWYVNKLHPYSSVFLQNQGFYFFSHLLPILAFLSLAVSKRKEKKVVIVFSALSLVSLLFTAGSHPPFGYFYIWMITHVPGFVAFRTPFYKFAPAVWLSYAILVAFSIDTLVRKVQKIRILPVILTCCMLLVWLCYNFPFFTGTFFDYEVGKKTTKVTVPSYITEYAKWSNSSDFKYRRLLLLPGQNQDTRFEAYTWKYWSLAQLPSLIDNRSYIGNTFYSGATEEILIKHLYELISKNDQSWVEEAQYLFVDAVLLRKDFDYNLENSKTTDPVVLEAFLNKDERFRKVKEFGQWEVYELKNHVPAFSLKKYFYEVIAEDKKKFFEPTTLPDITLDQDTVLLENTVESMPERRKGIIQIPECIHCLLDSRRLYPIDRNQLITGGSIFYQSHVKTDTDRLSILLSPLEKIDFNSQMITRRTYELSTQFGRKAEAKERLEGWKALVNAVRSEKTLIEEYFSSHKNQTIEENTFFSVLLENVAQQIQELQIGLEEVNQEEEAELFDESLSTLRSIFSQIQAELWYSDDNLTKKYLVNSQNPGQYEVFLKKSTANMFNSQSEAQPETQLQIVNNGIKYPLSLSEQNVDPQWARLGLVTLTTGLNRVQLQDIDAKIFFNKTGELTFQIDNNHRCYDLPIGNLDRNTYRVNFEATSIKDLDDLFVFFVEKNSTRTPLPFWGRKVLVDEQKRTFLDFNKEVIEPNEYVLKFCRLNTQEVQPQEIRLTNAYFERLSSPLIAFVKKDPNQATESSTLSVEFKEKNQTAYDVTLKGSGAALLMFDQQFEQGWQFTEANFLKDHQRVHGYANGWIVRKDDEGEKKLTIEYTGQKLYVYGWGLSLSTVSSICIYLIWRIVKKKEKK